MRALALLLVAGCGRFGFGDSAKADAPAGDTTDAADASPDAPTPPNRAFVTSATTNGGIL